MEHQPPDEDMMDEDMELQLALALSLQESTAADLGAAAPAAATAAAAGAPPAAAASAPAAGAAAAAPPQLADLAALLAQGLQAAQGTMAIPPPAPAPPPPPPPAAAAPPPPAAAPPAAAPGGDLLSMLAAQMQQFFGPGGAPGLGGQAQNSNQQQQQQQQFAQAMNQLAQMAQQQMGGGAGGGGGAAGRAARGAQVAALPAQPLPGWAGKLQRWWQAGSGRTGEAFGASSVVLGGPEALAAVCQHLGAALQVKVVSDSAAIGPGTLFLRTSAAAAGGGARELTADSLRSLVSSALLQRKVGAKDKLQALHRAHDELPAAAPGASPASDGGVAAALDLACGVLCREAFASLRDDGADLYFEHGASTTAFVDALAGGSSTMCEAFMDALLDVATLPQGSGGGEGAAEVWRRLCREALKAAFSGPRSKLVDAMAFERPLVVLDRLTVTPRMQQCLASLLLADVESLSRAAPAAAAAALELGSPLSHFLGCSPMPNSRDALYHMKAVSPARAAFVETRGYPKNHGAGQTCKTVLQGMMARLQDGAGHLMLRLSRTKDGGLTREALLSWVAAVGRANLVRCAFGETHEMRNQQDMVDFLAGGSDGFLLNVLGGCLRLAQPFTAGWLDLYRAGGGGDPTAAAAGAAPRKFADLFERHLRPGYYASQKHRVGDLSGAVNLTGSRGAGGFTTDDDPPTTQPPLLQQGEAVGGDGAPSFMADVFFLTQLMVHVGAIPTVNRTRAMMHRFHERYRHELNGGAGGGEGGAEADMRGRDPFALPIALEMQLYNDCTEAQLLEPLFADNLTAFAVLELDWVAWLARGGGADASATTSPGPSHPHAAALASLRLVPEYALADALDWLTYILQAGRADLVASKPIAVIMRALVSLLNANDLVRSAMVQNKIVNLLLAMLASQIQNVQSREARGLALAPDRMSTGERALVGAVLGTPVTQRDLVPALLRAHVNAELVVGLDVDKDSYDKYGMRTHIDNILEELIKDNVLRQRLTQLAAAAPATDGTDGTQQAGAAAASPSAPSPSSAPGVPSDEGLFSDYASGIVNTVMHFFKDGLDRLADIYAIERSKADAKAWAALPAEERQRKEDFYRGQQRAAKGFLRMGVVNLKWLNALTADPAIAAAFLVEPLQGRTAFLLVSCLELLLGDACKRLQVSNPESYSFDLPVLVGEVLGLLLALGRSERFVRAVVAEPDYSEEIMTRALAHTEANHQALLETRLRAFLATAADIRAAEAKAAAAGGEGLRALAPPPAGAAEAGGGPETPSGAAGGPPLKRRKSCEILGAGESMEVDGGASPAPALRCEAAAASLPGAPGPSAAELDAQYVAELGPLALDTYDSTVPGGYFKEMARLADQDTGASRAKMRRLMKEVADMQPGGRMALPMLSAAAIFVRQDENRTDKMRAVITGPQGTPYEGGLFVFDVFFPSGYPNMPPVMMVYNTGGGKARYNPNLYADGKVCLSLLGTYNSGHTSEKWNPDLSTLYQILVSVQSQILVDDPMTNEPLSETMAGTAEGAAKTAQYNARLQLMVMRHAMVDMLQHPPPGTQDIVTRHFRLLRHRLAATVAGWVRAAPDAELRSKLDEQAAKLMGLLAQL